MIFDPILLLQLNFKKMNTFCKRDIQEILQTVASKVQLDYKTLINEWNVATKDYCESKFGVNVEIQTPTKQKIKCSEAGCEHVVCRGALRANLMLCLSHFEKETQPLSSPQAIPSDAQKCFCEFEGCSKFVLKPRKFNDKIYCSLHLKNSIKQAKKSVGRCEHVYTAQSKTLQGQRCTSKVRSGSVYCNRHQKQTPTTKSNTE